MVNPEQLCDVMWFYVMDIWIQDLGNQTNRGQKSWSINPTLIIVTHCHFHSDQQIKMGQKSGSINPKSQTTLINPTHYFTTTHCHYTYLFGVIWDLCSLHMGNRGKHICFPLHHSPKAMTNISQNYVVPALVETALNMGNAGVTAVTQLHR